MHCTFQKLRFDGGYNIMSTHRSSIFFVLYLLSLKPRTYIGTLDLSVDKEHGH
jgi:hypothetical protein